MSPFNARLVFVVLSAAVVAATSLFGYALGERPFVMARETETATAAADSATFLNRRNQITIRVPRDMTQAEFVALYRLEHVRAQIPETLTQGQSVTVPLTPKSQVEVTHAPQ